MGNEDEDALLTAIGVTASALDANEPFPEGIRGERMRARARAAIGLSSGGRQLVELVLRAIGTRLEALVGPPGMSALATPVAVRGEADGGMLVRARLGERDIATYVDARPDGRFMILLDLGEDAAERRMRVTVSRGDREISSEMARLGRMRLPEMAVGMYRVRVEDLAGWVGDLDLRLERPTA
jgi:hypothetical protein